MKTLFRKAMIGIVLLFPAFQSGSQERAPDLLPKFPFYLIRHGETNWNVEGRIQGQKDVPLNDNGIQQARKAGNLLKKKGIRIRQIISSDLLRSRETARIIHDELKVPEPIRYNHDLAERSMGVLEGRLSIELGSNADLTNQSPPQGESFREFQNRTVKGIDESVHEEGTLIVTHGGVFGAFMEAIGHKNIFIRNAVPFLISPPSGAQKEWTVQAID